ncbi:hypothetical protein ACFL45_04410 [Candidatus Neomarinimicrobiota bacterium]
MWRNKSSIVAAIMFGMLLPLWAQWGPGAVVEEGEFGAVNYSQRMVQATGIGSINPNAASVGAARAGAITAARMDAYRRLLEMVMGVRVTSETTVQNSMVGNDVITTQVNGMVRGARQVGDAKYLSDTSVEITMEVPMSGIMDILLPAVPAQPTGSPSPTTASPTAPSATTAITTEVPGQPVTGVIIDARGLGIRPSMSPQILGDDGMVLYGPGKYPRDFAVAQGVVGYHKDIDAAKQDSRVAGNPLTIKGTGISGTLGADVQISAADAQRAVSYPGFMDAIGNCRVMFILD